MTSSLLRALLAVSAPLLLAGPALANEVAAAGLKASVPVSTGAPLVLGAPPAWMVMVLGATIVSLTLLRRARKGT